MNEEEDVILDTSNETAEEADETPADEANADSEVDIEQVQATNKRLFERAKKAEAELKAFKANKPAEAKTVSPQPSVEELILQDKGMSDELIAELKTVAQVRKISLIKAQNDPIFVAIKENFEKDQKQKDASLPASRGSGSVKAKKDFATPGLSRDEHRKMVIGK